jgi:hypothetical protein
MKILSDLRQWRFPREFRISRPVWPEEMLAGMRELKELLSQPTRETESRPEPSTAPERPADETMSREHLRFLADVATGLWRMRLKMIEPETQDPRDDMKRVLRHMEAIWDALNQEGLLVQDHTGSPFNSGMWLRVVAFQPTAGLGREKVIETIKPSVYFKGRPIQMGEVIVGTPPYHDSDEEHD